MPSNTEQKDPGALVVPFGKHRGATVVELLAKDPPYVEWLMAQDWLSQRFAAIHAAIASRGTMSDDSPEHNALQVRFLDPGFRLACLRLAIPDRLERDKKAARDNYLRRASSDLEKASQEKRSIEAVIKAGFPHWRASVTVPQDPQDWQIAQATTLGEAEKAEIAAVAAVERASATEFHATTGVAFEKLGIDVIVGWEWAAPSEHPRRQPLCGVHGADGRLFGDQIPIELKPSFGDDYPAVMRQMQRLRAWTLVAGSYCGTTVNESQVREMFRANGYTLIFVQEIEQKIATINRMRNE